MRILVAVPAKAGHPGKLCHADNGRCQFCAPSQSKACRAGLASTITLRYMRDVEAAVQS